MSKKDVKKKAPQKTAPAPQKPVVKEESKAEIQPAPAPAGKRVSERQLIRQAQQDVKQQRRRRDLIVLGVVVGLVGIFVLSLIFGSSQPVVTGSLVEEGSLDCFPAGLLDAQGAPVDCSVSAVLFDAQGNLNFASRNPIPGAEYSPIFNVPFSSNKPASDTLTYLSAGPFLKALDFESMANSSNGEYVFALTGFDRVKTDSDEWNYYNMLLAWPPSDPGKVQIVSATTTPEGISSSVSMRNKFTQLLNGSTSFKIGGLAAIKGYLIFGLTEINTFPGQIKLFAVPYTVSSETGEILLSDNFQIKFTLEPAKSAPAIGQSLSLVSLEYDPYRDSLLMMAAGPDGAYLWTLALKNFSDSGQATLVTDGSGAPFKIVGQPAGITVIDQDTYLVATNASGREPQQATYQIIKFIR